MNGEVWTENSVANILHSPRELVAFHSAGMTLRPSDVITTGTPGAHVVAPGDAVTVKSRRSAAISADVIR